jgi:hypothetical protein
MIAALRDEVRRGTQRPLPHGRGSARTSEPRLSGCGRKGLEAGHSGHAVRILKSDIGSKRLAGSEQDRLSGLGWPNSFFRIPIGHRRVDRGSFPDMPPLKTRLGAAARFPVAAGGLPARRRLTTCTTNAASSVLAASVAIGTPSRSWIRSERRALASGRLIAEHPAVTVLAEAVNLYSPQAKPPAPPRRALGAGMWGGSLTGSKEALPYDR